MKKKMQSFINTVKETVSGQAHILKDKVDHVIRKKSVTIDVLSEMIKHHPNTNVNKQTFLGLTYFFYELKVDDVVFAMETKGETGRHVLYLTIHTNAKVLLTYRSYEGQIQRDQPIKLEEIISQIVKEETV